MVLKGLLITNMLVKLMKSPSDQWKWLVSSVEGKFSVQIENLCLLRLRWLRQTIPAVLRQMMEMIIAAEYQPKNFM